MKKECNLTKQKKKPKKPLNIVGWCGVVTALAIVWLMNAQQEEPAVEAFAVTNDQVEILESEAVPLSDGTDVLPDRFVYIEHGTFSLPRDAQNALGMEPSMFYEDHTCDYMILEDTVTGIQYWVYPYMNQIVPLTKGLEEE